VEGIKGFLPLKEGRKGKDREGRGVREEKEKEGREGPAAGDLAPRS